MTKYEFRIHCINDGINVIFVPSVRLHLFNRAKFINQKQQRNTRKETESKDHTSVFFQALVCVYIAPIPSNPWVARGGGQDTQGQGNMSSGPFVLAFPKSFPLEHIVREFLSELSTMTDCLLLSETCTYCTPLIFASCWYSMLRSISAFVLLAVDVFKLLLVVSVLGKLSFTF